MKDFLTVFLAALSSFTKETDDGLANLPPLEQSEASEALSWHFSCMQRWVGDTKARIQAFESDMLKKFETAEKQSAEDLETLTASIKAELLNDGEFISKADHDIAMQTAVDAAKETASTEFQNQLAADKVAAERQVALNSLTPEGVTVEFPESVIKLGDSEFELATNKIQERLSALEESKINSEGALKQVCLIPVDEAGDATFAERVETWESLSKPPATAIQSAAKPFPTKPQPASEPEPEKDAEIIMV